MGRQWSSGHLPAGQEPGSWASPGPSGSTETQRKPPGHVTLCRQGTSGMGGRRPEKYSRPPIPGDVVGADFSVSSATERPVMVAGAALISQRAIKLGVDPTVL